MTISLNIVWGRKQYRFKSYWNMIW